MITSDFSDYEMLCYNLYLMSILNYIAILYPSARAVFAQPPDPIPQTLDPSGI